MLAGYDEMSGFERDEDSPLQNSFELPAARLRREALGEDDDCEWKCAICPLADRSTRPEDLPPCIAEFREALASQPRVLPELEACRLLSALFNRTCYARDRARSEASCIGVTPITPADVRAHLTHSRHLRENEDHMLDDRIWYTLRMTEQLERTGLWFENVDGHAKLNRDGFADWCKVQDTLKKLVEIRQRFHGSGREGGVQKRRTPPRRHYSRTG